jgi:hypothetical protein
MLSSEPVSQKTYQKSLSLPDREGGKGDTAAKAVGSSLTKDSRTAVAPPCWGSLAPSCRRFVPG